MGSKSFLSADEQAEARERLKSARPNNVRLPFHLDEAFLFSQWLGEKLEARLQKHPRWRETRPIKLGSWARGELCAKSDIDLLFVGDESAVAELVADCQRDGLKIRSRVPADRNDWTSEVEGFDVLALMSALPFHTEDQSDLTEQIAKNITARGLTYKKKLFRAMLAERKDRAKRYDSIANFLEPNLKHGPGGLRDLEQGLLIQSLYPKLFADEKETLSRLKSFKSFFLLIRHWVHLEGGTDVLLGSHQAELAKFLKYESAQKFMADLEYGLSGVSFYADWISDRARRGQIYQPASDITTFESAIKLLAREPDLPAQKAIRAKSLKFADSRKKFGRILEKNLNGETAPEFVDALFRSKLLGKILPDLERVTGHVQHDQYHRYSVDAHTNQAVREVLRVKAHPKTLGPLADVVKRLNKDDWAILIWSALFHDLGKGLVGDHSQKGAEIVKRELTSLGVSLKLTTQVAWMVQNHLLLSGAAFRRNPQDPSLWSELFSRGVKGARLHRLAVFTAIDIRATNLEAWNDWKAQLLSQLVKSLTSPSAHSFSELLEYAEKKKIKISRDWLDQLDPLVVERLPRAELIKDYRALNTTKGNLPPLILKNRHNETWVRYHARVDRPGLFLQFVKQLFAAGLSIQEAFVQTYSSLGVYDWFKIKTSKPVPALKAMLTKMSVDEIQMSAPDVIFSKVELISEDDESAILSFSGRDQKGALMAAAQMIFHHGLEIQSAKVHTWGRQIEDIFTLKKSAEDDRRFSTLLT